MNYRADFPIFASRPDLVYLDSAATTQKPEAVIQAVENFYRQDYATIHRGLYELSIASTEKYEAVRAQVAQFINARSAKEIVFTRGATESLNLLAFTLSANLKEGDEIILSELEHHANLVPWQQVAQTRKLQLKFIRITKQGDLDLDHFSSLITEKTSIVSLSHCSNVLGSFTPFPKLKKILQKQGSQALIIADACQSIAHIPISVGELGCDFLVFSGHKLYAPSGTGILWGRHELLSTLLPYQTGGDMITSVSFEGATWNELPWKFEAGTPNIEGVTGLGAAISYLETITMSEVAKYIGSLTTHAYSLLKDIDELEILGSPSPESGLISFTVKEMHPHDIAELLGQKKICIRAGNHCAAPLHSVLGINASNRISLGIYNTNQDIELFIKGLTEIISDFKNV